MTQQPSSKDLESEPHRFVERAAFDCRKSYLNLGSKIIRIEPSTIQGVQQLPVRRTFATFKTLQARASQLQQPGNHLVILLASNRRRPFTTCLEACAPGPVGGFASFRRLWRSRRTLTDRLACFHPLLSSMFAQSAFASLLGSKSYWILSLAPCLPSSLWAFCAFPPGSRWDQGEEARCLDKLAWARWLKLLKQLLKTICSRIWILWKHPENSCWEGEWLRDRPSHTAWRRADLRCAREQSVNSFKSCGDTWRPNLHSFGF